MGVQRGQCVKGNNCSFRHDVSGQCTHKHPTALSNLIDPFSEHMLVCLDENPA